MNGLLKHISGLLLFAILAANSFAREVSDTNYVNRGLLKGVIICESAVSAASLTALYFARFADRTQPSFHFVNDNKYWLQMDKMEHATTAYNIGRAGYALLRWPGVDKKRSVWFGGTLGFAYMTIVEIMQGFSEGWGASPGDMAANAMGTGLFVGQQILWDEQRFSLKYSYHESGYAPYRPSVLGSNLPKRMLKDYNGQTYWLSANIRSFLRDDTGFPGWLNIALGYSAEGMLDGTTNPSETDGIPIPLFDRNRRFFLSPDIDLARIKTDSKALKTLLWFAGVFKFPFPALEYNTGRGWEVHLLYY
jgi:VanZ family protein